MYTSFETQQHVNTSALICAVFGVIGLVVGITQLNKKRQLVES
ncbi:hypothetical protein D028_3546 [Vibrio parahaemolyticus 50]|nr:hypothetical protein D028_3546 [Vibrio parahaemolyticus 50]EVT83346.1 hypothetical protein D018_3730 [Vibrio parahaemolyticus VP2007-007]